MNDIKIDVVNDIFFGDSGKGQITQQLSLLSSQNKYTHCIRYNGGANAGHTVYVDGKKIVTHIVPTGIVNGLKCIIGNGCVLNVEGFFKELKELEDAGIQTKNKVFISRACHIVTDAHLEEEKNETTIGTTKRGIGPCYRDKILRTGIRAESIPELQPYLIDMYHEFYEVPGSKYILAEGAQALGLDIDLGDYPFVTSSNCGIGAVLNNGFNHKHINKVYSVAKVYTTYVGSKKFHSTDPIFDKIQLAGKEFGATTGRKRQCNLLNIDQLVKGANILGTTTLVLTKLDIFEEVNFFRYLYGEVEFDFDNVQSFKENLVRVLQKELGPIEIIFTTRPVGF